MLENNIYICFYHYSHKVYRLSIYLVIVIGEKFLMIYEGQIPQSNYYM